MRMVVQLSKTIQKVSLRDQYFEGKIPVEQYLDYILNSEDGDRTRREVVRKHKELLQKCI